MSNVLVKSYLSPTLVLLAMDWDEGFTSNDFLGFAIKRTPGFRNKNKQSKFDWLPNRIGFDGPNASGKDLPSNTNPIQHFQWWDARIDTRDRGQTFTYDVYPVKGPWNNLSLAEANKSTIKCIIPQVVEHNIGTYFNRAVVSSQAFAKQFGKITTHAQYVAALEWLSNGMNEALITFISDAHEIGLAGAAYHLTDNQWTIPALQTYDADASFVCFYKAPTKSGKGKGDATNNAVIKTLKPNKNIRFFLRTKANIMHDKFIVRTKGDQQQDAEAVLMGTANFTVEGLTQQANVIHTFESPELAGLYLQRQVLLRDDPTIAKTAAGAKWSNFIQIGDATIRVFFAPETPSANLRENIKGSRLSIDAVVNAVRSAKSSVMFSLFSATDKDLLEACESVAEAGLLMRGLVNIINDKDPLANDDGTQNASTVAATWLYDRSKEDYMVVGHADFGKNDTPSGFWPETNTLVDPTAAKTPVVKGSKKTFSPAVYIHQKIVIIDGETETPTIYVGSANLSGNSTWHNDENLIEITNCARLSNIYVAEFMRLYEQYRARFEWNRLHLNGDPTKPNTFSLTKDTSWAAKDYKAGTMECISRKAFAGA